MMRISMWALVALFACGKSGASKQAPPDPAPAPAAPGKSARVTKLVERLQTHDAASVDATMAEIDALTKEPTFSEAEGTQLLRSTVAPFPKSEIGDVPSRIIAAVGQHRRDSYAVVMEEMFPKWKQPARAAAVRVLSTISSPTGTAVFVRLLKQYIADPNVQPALMLLELEGKPHHAAEIVPTLIELTQRPAWADDANHLLLAYCKQGLLQTRLYPGKLDSILAAYRTERDWLAPKQRTAAPGFAWTEEYADHRERASVLLDLMQCVPGADNLDELHAALKMKDARLVYFATTSLLENDMDVPDATYEQIAASPEMRGWLHEELPKHRRDDKFPAKYATQAALAEADMVRWLSFATELGRAPDEIALGKIVTIEDSDYYVFKFRTVGTYWASSKGWMAGISGPYVHGAEPTSDGAGGTFSNLDAYGSKTPEQHVAALAKITSKTR
jgi:hypothetical protein